NTAPKIEKAKRLPSFGLRRGWLRALQRLTFVLTNASPFGSSTDTTTRTEICTSVPELRATMRRTTTFPIEPHRTHSLSAQRVGFDASMVGGDAPHRSCDTR